MYIFFPGTCFISLKWTLISRILNLWIPGGSWSSVWVLKSGTRGLWSLSTEIDFPTMYSQDRSHAHVSARASFSICAYLVSVGGIARDMNDTGRQELSGWSWRTTPPRPKAGASAATLGSLFGSYRASTRARVRSALICSNAFFCSLPHVHWFPLWRRSLMLFVLSARWSENLLSWFTIPRNVLSYGTFWGGGRSAIACSFSGSASIPQEITTCPRNLTLSVPSWHLSKLSVTPASNRRMSTASNLWSCLVWSFP